MTLTGGTVVAGQTVNPNAKLSICVTAPTRVRLLLSYVLVTLINNIDVKQPKA